MKNLYKNRLFGFAVIFAVYIFAAGAGALVYLLADDLSFAVRVFLTDIAATLLVWLAGILLKNSSVYDPYWSVAPLVIAPLAAYYYNTPLKLWLPVLIVIFAWGIRLTANWAYTFKNLEWQDWRYTKFKKSSPFVWFLANLFGINLMPTIFVFGGLLPVTNAFRYGTAASALTYTGLSLSLLAAVLQATADITMHKFRNNPLNKGEINYRGVWAWSRHPNYLGEILFWWGMYIVLLSVRAKLFAFFISPLIITLMFIFISIPLMEKKQLKSKPAYLLYKQQVSMLLLIPPRKRL